MASSIVSSTLEHVPWLPVHRSRDLVHRELVGHVLDGPGQVDLSQVGDSGGLLAMGAADAATLAVVGE